MMRQASTLNQRDCPRPMPSVKDVPGHGRGDSPKRLPEQRESVAGKNCSTHPVISSP